MTDNPNNASWNRPLLISGAILTLPPLMALLTAIWPGLLPIPFVEVDPDAGFNAFLAVVAAGLLIFNAGFLYLMSSYID
jgi:hypothetical protein